MPSKSRSHTASTLGWASAITAALVLVAPSQALAAPPALTWSPQGPNPMLLSLDVPAQSRNIYYNRHIPSPNDKTNKVKKCGSTHLGAAWMTPEPVATLTIPEGVSHLTFLRRDFPQFVLIRPGGGYYCSGEPRKHAINIKDPTPGVWKIHAYTTLKRKEGTPPALGLQGLTIYSKDLPLRREAKAETHLRISAEMKKPVRHKGSLPAALTATTDGCSFHVSQRPVAFVTTSLPKARLRLSIKAEAATLLVRDVDPKNPRSLLPPKCSSRTVRSDTVGAPGSAPRTYAVWVATDKKHAKAPFELTLSHPAMTPDAMFQAKPIVDGLPVAKRVVSWYYPPSVVAPFGDDRAQRRAAATKLWDMVDPRVVVYATDKRAHRGAMVGEPLLLLQGSRAITLAGHRVSIRFRRALSVTPPAALQAPQPRGLPNKVLMNSERLKKAVSPKLGKLIDKAIARENRYADCYKKTFAKYDNTGSAYKKQLVTRRNGRVIKVENWGSKIAKKSAKKCKYKAMQKLVDKMNKAVSADWAKQQTVWLQQRRAAIAKRLTP